jgi:hypothetical protein
MTAQQAGAHRFAPMAARGRAPDSTGWEAPTPDRLPPQEGAPLFIAAPLPVR